MFGHHSRFEVPPPALNFAAPPENGHLLSPPVFVPPIVLSWSLVSVLLELIILLPPVYGIGL